MANTIAKWIVLFPLIAWFMMAAMSPMMFDAPGASDSRKNLLTALGLLSYPLIIFGIFWLLGWKFFFFHVKYWFAIYLALYMVVTSYVYLGLFNNLRGIRNEGFSIVDQQVYYSGKRHPTADAATLVTHGDQDYYNPWAWDKNHLYHSGKVVDGITPNLQNQPRSLDPDSEVLSSSVIVFGDTIIYHDRVLEGVSAAKTLPFEGKWSEQIILVGSDNGTRVFINGKEHAHLDGGSLESMGFRFLRDKQGLYDQYGKPVNGIKDIATLNIENDQITLGHDQHHWYLFHKEGAVILEDVHTDSLEVLSSDYLKDKNQVYYVEGSHYQALPDADPATFTVKFGELKKGYYRAFDRNHYYFDGDVVAPRSQ